LFFCVTVSRTLPDRSMCENRAPSYSCRSVACDFAPRATAACPIGKSVCVVASRRAARRWCVARAAARAAPWLLAGQRGHPSRVTGKWIGSTVGRRCGGRRPKQPHYRRLAYAQRKARCLPRLLCLPRFNCCARSALQGQGTGQFFQLVLDIKSGLSDMEEKVHGEGGAQKSLKELFQSVETSYDEQGKHVPCSFCCASSWARMTVPCVQMQMCAGKLRTPSARSVRQRRGLKRS
jgi:hypothetical protein